MGSPGPSELSAQRRTGRTRWPAFLFRSIFAFKVFDEIFLLTSGGPGTATDVVSLHLFKVFFEQNNLGYGAMLSIVIILAIVARAVMPHARMSPCSLRP